MMILCWHRARVSQPVCHQYVQPESLRHDTACVLRQAVATSKGQQATYLWCWLPIDVQALLAHLPAQLLTWHNAAALDTGPADACTHGPPETFTHNSCDLKAELELADAMPTMGHLQPPFPYLSCCNQRGSTSTLLMPSDLEPAQFLEQPLRSGASDTRDPRAIFLGSPTGDLAAGFQV